MTRTGTDLGRCTGCGGRIAATHMLTKTYPLDTAGCWQRRFADFTEDVVVVCVDCGVEPAGGFGGDGTSFAFVPDRIHATDTDGERGEAAGGERL
jgi:hypothetical protein